MTAKGELYWDDGESIIEKIDTYNFYWFDFTFIVDKSIAELTIERKRDAVGSFFSSNSLSTPSFSQQLTTSRFSATRSCLYSKLLR